MQQRKMPLVGEAKQMEYAPFELIQRCNDAREAIQLCIQLSRLPNEHVATQLNIDPGHLTRILSGQANFLDQKRNDLMRLCGNRAPQQYDAWDLDGADITPELSAKEKRRQELLTELAQLDEDAQAAG